MWKCLLLLSIIGCMNCMQFRSASAEYEDFMAADDENSALLLAAAQNRQDVMEFLLENGADINIRASNGSTILHMAAARGDVSAVEFITNHGIDEGLFNNDGLTALHLAALNCKFDVIDVLLAYGADVNARASNGQTILHLLVAKNMTESMEFVLRLDNVFMSPKNNDLSTPVALADRLGHAEIAVLLRNMIGDITTNRLAFAVEHRDLDLIQSLVLRGADVNDLYPDGHGVWTPLQRASGRYADIAIVIFLVKHGAEVNLRETTLGRTALWEASFWGYLDIVKYLVGNGADVNAMGNGETPLKIATIRNHKGVAAYLKSVGGKMYTPHMLIPL